MPEPSRHADAGNESEDEREDNQVNPPVYQQQTAQVTRQNLQIAPKDISTVTQTKEMLNHRLNNFQQTKTTFQHKLLMNQLRNQR